MRINKIAASIISLGMAASPFAQATNGMLMEGYGPISTAMGGASMAYDNGAAGMANNPATLGMMEDGTSRFDLAIGGMHPDVVSKMSGMPDAESGGTAYYMPALGWVKKSGQLTYGVGVFAQGGMGTEYSATDWVSAGSGRPSRSEVGVGNLIIPVSFDVNPDLKIGGSFDFVWSGLDLQMAMSSGQMSGLESQGNLNMTMGGGAFTSGDMSTMMGYTVAQFDFSDDSSFTGKAKSTGYAAKLGMTYKVSQQLSLGATYHSKTSLGDMTANGAIVRMIDPTGTNPTQTMTGEITVVDFQFPEVFGFGAAFQASDELMVVADFKRIGWKDVMENFHMTYTSAGIGMGAVTMDMKMPQNWKDQNVINLGAAYRMNEALTLRAGTNQSSNPVPDDTVNPLFPATVKSHYMAGAGYALNKTSDVNGSFTYVPKVTVTAPAAAGGYTIEHSQMNWQLMYSNRF